jgi:hypothetical protein
MSINDYITDKVKEAEKNAFSEMKHEIKSIMFQAKSRNDIIGFYRSEKQKYDDFTDTFAGNAYINMNFPFDIKIDVIINLYEQHDIIKADYVYIDTYGFYKKFYMCKYLDMCIKEYIKQADIKQVQNHKNLLQKDEAKALLEVAKEAKLLDDNYKMPNRFTNADRAKFAEQAALFLEWGHIIYPPFENLWGIKNLSKYLSRTKIEIGRTKHQDEIKAFFEKMKKRLP